MSNRKRIASVAFTGAAAATAIGMGTPAAFAASTWHISPANTNITGTNSTATLLTGPNGSTSVLLTCTVHDATLTGTTGAASVPGPSPQLATITGGTFGTNSPCASPEGEINFKATLHAGKLIGKSQPTTGVTKGTLKSISATLSGYNSAASKIACTVAVTGSVGGTYNNNSGVLTALDSTPKLTLGTVTGFPCSAVLTTGEHVGFKGNFKITPKVTISKP
jgi:hypothetical protein